MEGGGCVLFLFCFSPFLPLKATFWGTDLLIVPVGCACYQENKQVFVEFVDKNCYAVGNEISFCFLNQLEQL